MSEEKVRYDVGENEEVFNKLNTLDDFIKHYGIDYGNGWTKDFNDRKIASAVDDVIRVVKSFVENPTTQESYKVEKLRCAIRALTEADRKLTETSE